MLISVLHLLSLYHNYNLKIWNLYNYNIRPNITNLLLKQLIHNIKKTTDREWACNFFNCSDAFFARYTLRCNDDEEQIFQYPEDLKSGFVHFIENESHLNILMTVFALTTALSSALCVFILYLYVRQKKNRDLLSRKCQPCSAIGAAHIMHTESPSSSAESTRRVALIFH